MLKISADIIAPSLTTNWDLINHVGKIPVLKFDRITHGNKLCCETRNINCTLEFKVS